jgi:hypothetical protein
MDGWTNIELQLEMPPHHGDVVACSVNDEPHEAEIVAVGPYLWEIRIRIRGMDLHEHYVPTDLFGEAGIAMHVNRDGWGFTGIRSR